MFSSVFVWTICWRNRGVAGDLDAMALTRLQWRPMSDSASQITGNSTVSSTACSSIISVTQSCCSATYNTMTLWHGHALRTTAPLWRESIGKQCILLKKPVIRKAFRYHDIITRPRRIYPCDTHVFLRCFVLFSLYHCPWRITVTSSWARWRLISPAYRFFAQPFVQAQI